MERCVYNSRLQQSETPHSETGEKFETHTPYYSDKFTFRAFIMNKQAIRDTKPSYYLSETGIELSYIPLYIVIYLY